MAIKVILSEKDSIVWQCIIEYKTRYRGNSPSSRQIAIMAHDKGCDMSNTTAQEAIRRMIALELLEKKDGCLMVAWDRWYLGVPVEIEVEQ